MKILQIIPGLTLGGPTFSVTTLTRYLSKLGHCVQLYTEDTNFQGYNDIDIHPFNILNFPYNKQLAFSTSLRKELRRECKDADIIQTNSLWQYPNFVMEYARKASSAKSVIVPRGTLSEYALSLSSVKKRLVLAIGQRKALHNADMFIATCEKEYHDIRAFGLKQPVAIIPNGLELPSIPSSVVKKKKILFLARIHKIKGLDILINAWREISHDHRFSDWDLIIAGPKESDYAQRMISLASDLERVTFVGEISGQNKINLMAESFLYVLPTHTENFGISIAEALAAATPVITTTGAPWKGVEEHNCGKWIELSPENLKQALIQMMSKSESELIQMGKNGRNWVSHEFSWTEIADKTVKSYEWLLNPTSIDIPAWIRIN